MTKTKTKTAKQPKTAKCDAKGGAVGAKLTEGGGNKAPCCTFVATVKTSPLDRRPYLNEITVTLPKCEAELLWDDVVDAVYGVMEKEFPFDCYPKADIHEVFIFGHNDKSKRYPVVRSGDVEKIKELDKSKTYEKFLVLEEAKYSLTPEYALFLQLQEVGLLHADDVFDSKKMREVIDGVKGHLKD